MKIKAILPRRFVPANNLAITLIVVSFSFLFAGCSTDNEGFQWLLGQEGSSSTPVPGTIQGNFSLEISDVQGRADFLFDLEVGSTIDIFTIVLDGFSPDVGSLAQIRETMGSTLGRVVFQGVPDENGNLTGSYSIDTNTDELILNFTYEGETYFFKINVTALINVNRTIYIDSIIEAIEPPVSNEPPIANAGEGQVVECPACDVQLDGSGSSDPDRDELTYSWTYGDSTWVGVNPVVKLPLGEHTITLTVDDGQGETDSDEVAITVVDTTPPELITVSDPYILWPPNHKYHTFNISDFMVSVSDLCDENVSENGVVITRVTSDEPENQTGSNNGRGRKGGGGDGNTSNDIVVSQDGLSVDLRAERLGGGNGRTYTVFVGVVDASGNQTESSFQVHVPHNKKRAVIDDGVAYEVSGLTPQSSAPDPIAVASNTGSGINFDAPVTSNNEVNNFLPEAFGLNQNYPNPFNPSTVISYQVPEQAHVTIEVFDITGKRIASLVNETKSQGHYEVSFNAQNINSGVYFYRIAAGNYTEMKRMTLIK